MKSINLILTMLIVFAFANTSFGQIDGTAHDFGLSGFNASSFTDDMCYVCHEAHNNVNDPTELLWNQTITTETFTMYSNPATIDGAIDAQPSGTSKLCLSCHDDATAMGTGGIISVEYGGTTADLGTDLTNDHPIGIVYDEVADAGLNDPATHTNVVLFATKVECASCHNAHDDSNGSFLRVTNNVSQLCLECHNK